MFLNARDTVLKLLDSSIDFSIKIIEHGQVHEIGARKDVTEFEIEILDKKIYRDFLYYGNLGLGEGFIHEKYKLQKGKLEELIAQLLRVGIDQKLKVGVLLGFKILPFRLMGSLQRYVQHIHHHYDIDFEIFKNFLDSSLTYSCGYADSISDDLDTMQRNKYHRICQKLRLQAGESLLDIGCGYGGMLIHAAKYFGVYGVGITNSENHYSMGKQKIKEAGLENNIKIELKDFRLLKGNFDKVISIGMLEHVARSHYATYFNLNSKILKKDGLGLVHFVGANTLRNDHDYFIQKYIFPMSNQPRLSEVCEKLERYGLPILDVENMIRHYGYTAQHWLNNFRTNYVAINKELKMKRMFEYYLACCVAAAKYSDAALYQVLFAHDTKKDIALHRI